MWEGLNNEGKNRIVNEYLKGYSVYSLAISPNGKKLAVGTRAGLIQVFSLINYRPTEDTMPEFKVYHQANCPVVSLAFCTDDILASGGLDGNIKFWSITDQNHQAVFKAHQGGVLALASIGSLILASIGKDQCLRIWDLDSLEVQFESDPFPLPKYHVLISLEYITKTGQLMHPSQTGELYVYNVFNNFKRSKVSVHQGDFCAVTCGPENIITGGLNDQMLKVWSLSLDQVINEVPSDKDIVDLAFSPPGTVVSIHSDGTGQIWNLNDTLSSVSVISDHDLRVCKGLPEKLITNLRISQDQKWRDVKLAELKELLGSTQPQKQREFYKIAEELNHRGFGIEVVLMMTEAAWMQKDYLWLLECLLTLAENFEEPEETTPVYHALGDLLVKMKEPGLGIKYLKKVKKIDSKYRNVADKLARAQADPLIKVPVGKGVRGDITQPDIFIKELKKHELLRKKYNWKTIIKRQDPMYVKALVEPEAIYNIVIAEASQYNIDDALSKKQNLLLYDDNIIKNVHWLCFAAGDSAKGVLYCLEVNKSDNKTEFNTYLLFDPGLLNLSESLAVERHNQIIQDSWTHAVNSESVKSWFSKVNSLVVDSIRMSDCDNKF